MYEKRQTAAGPTRPLRADAQRNRESILDAALRCFGDNPTASMAAIAEAAKVGRVTLYGHFASRADLVAALFDRTLERSNVQLGAVDISGEPLEALRRLTTSAWQIVDSFHSLLGVAEDELGGAAVRDHVEKVLAQVEGLFTRGQAEGAFRADVPASWLTTCYFAILHSGAAELRAGRMSEADAAWIVPDTVASLARRRTEPTN
jgi:AcrR family transcriptional regulator